MKSNLSIEQVLNLSTDALAYIGDAYFTLFCRLKVLEAHNAKPSKLHTTVTNLVNAHAQSVFLERLTPDLTQEELDISRRARNSPTTTKSKHYGLAEYKKATSFEAVLGYLYLVDQKRLNLLLEKALKGVSI